jgi:hypothetical protein
MTMIPCCAKLQETPSPPVEPVQCSDAVGWQRCKQQTDSEARREMTNTNISKMDSSTRVLHE